MAYLTYSEYIEMGGALNVAAFLMQEFRARQLVDQLTHNRIRGETPVREAVKYAMRALIDAQAASDAHDGRVVASESNDGLSRSYTVNGPGDAHARRVDIVCEYLANEVTAAGVPLLYAGVDA